MSKREPSRDSGETTGQATLQHSTALVASLSNLRGRAAVVTGGGQGIGRALALGYAAAGAAVVIADWRPDGGEAVANEIRAAGGNAFATRTDVGDVSSVKDMANRVEKEFGRIDILVNNAAVFSDLALRPFDEIPLDEWALVMRVNVDGAMFASRAVVPVMRRQGWGRIINMSSTAVRIGKPLYLHYSTSKAALIGMTRSLARELGPEGITVNAILPGAVTTEVIRPQADGDASRAAAISAQCIQRGQRASDLIGAAVFLASEAAGFVTGQSVVVDGGMTHG